MRRTAVLIALALAAALEQAPARANGVQVDAVRFSVTNPLESSKPLSARGFIYRPSAAACSNSVVLMVHGLSYGYWGWDFPIEPETYSAARALAARGYTAVAIDLPGYGSSDKNSSGYLHTIESYAEMVTEIARELRAGTFEGPKIAFRHVTLMGHSAGTEISELAAALHPEQYDALIATGYTHFPSQRIVTDFATGDNVRAAQSDYEYFGGTPEVRSEYMYNLTVAHPDVVAKDNALANLTPSGEVFTIDPQPSGKVMQKIMQPVLLLLAEKDLLFPVENGDQELALFVASADRTKLVAASAGHSFMLHPNAPDVFAKVADWLDARQEAMPRC